MVELHQSFKNWVGATAPTQLYLGPPMAARKLKTLPPSHKY
jgi:hypothetical protein